LAGVNRTDRLYALVEELRAVAPRPRSARWLATRFEMSVRTMERDIGALQESGVPIYAEPGRTGGYCLDKARTLPPINLTPAEAVAMALALRRLKGTPFQEYGGTALRKLVAAMHTDDAEAARALASRIHLLGDGGANDGHANDDHANDDGQGHGAGRHVDGGPKASMPRWVADALENRRVLRIGYADREGAVTMREIEPLGYVGKPDHWYLVAWCRLRDALRVFRTDRITTVSVTAEVPPPRELRGEDLDIPSGKALQLTLN
jgi:predicted DNA-binding transcriptional regulator YafY